MVRNLKILTCLKSVGLKIDHSILSFFLLVYSPAFFMQAKAPNPVLQGGVRGFGLSYPLQIIQASICQYRHPGNNASPSAKTIYPQ
uniref:Uncharacterized protein n=1 Tax=mine drainage metagenome TaxID=410659 RepID=E6QTS2_9ZZZZ